MLLARRVAAAAVAAAALVCLEAPAGAAPHPLFDDGGTLDWYPSLDAARAAAEAQGKLIFVESGRRECGNCRSLVETVLPARAVRSRIAAIAVGLADDVDASDPRVEAIFAQGLGRPSMLPFAGFVTPSLRWVTGWSGWCDEATVCSHLDVAEQRLAYYRSVRAESARARAAASAPKPAPRVEAPAPRPALPPSPAVAARPPAPRAAAAPPAVAKAEPVPAPVGRPRAAAVPTEPACDPRTGSCSAPPLRTPARSIASRDDDDETIGEEPALVATPPVAAATPPPRVVPAPAPAAPPVPARALATAPAAPSVPPPMKASVAATARSSTWPPASTQGPGLAVAPSAPHPAASPARRPGTPGTKASLLVVEARVATAAQSWGTVLRVADQAAGLPRDADVIEIELLARRAASWSLDRLQGAADAARDRRYATAIDSLGTVRREMVGRVQEIDASRGERAVERLAALDRIGASDRLGAEAGRRKAYADFRGTRWAALFLPPVEPLSANVDCAR